LITNCEGTSYIEYPEKTKKKYKQALIISTKKPKLKTKNSIQSFFSTDASGVPPLAIPSLTGDNTTWERERAGNPTKGLHMQVEHTLK
jgi:hypothetical protein